jgi:hypothetical protein
MRAAVASAPLYLYVADGKVHRYDPGTGIVDVTTATNAPAAALIRAYHLRAFWAGVTNYDQHLFWSKMGDPEDDDTGLPTDAGSAMVDVLRGEGLTALETIGSSLLIATPDSIARFTGYSNEDIQIAQDSEGVSADVGTVGVLAFSKAEKIEPDFLALDRTVLSASVVGYHKARRELWFAVPGSGDSSTNKTVYVYSFELDAWSGPFTFPFAITCFANFEDSNGDENLAAGCTDGFVRLMDTGTKDDVLSDGTGGSAFTMTTELAPIISRRVLGLKHLFVEADLTASETSTLKLAFDDDSFVNYTLTGVGSNVQDYRVDSALQGKRLRVQFVDSGTARSLNAENYAAVFFLPVGSTIKVFEARVYRAGSGDSVVALLKRFDDSGSPTTLSTLTSSSTGYHTEQESGLSEQVRDDVGYEITLTLDANTAAVDVRLVWCKITYLRPALRRGF